MKGVQFWTQRTTGACYQNDNKLNVGNFYGARSVTIDCRQEPLSVCGQQPWITIKFEYEPRTLSATSNPLIEKGSGKEFI